jgi:hypothetical protein
MFSLRSLNFLSMFIVLVGCGSKKTNPQMAVAGASNTTPNTTPKSCVVLGSTVSYSGDPVDSAGKCVTLTSGMWAKYTFDAAQNFASVECNVQASTVPVDQAAFTASLVSNPAVQANTDFIRSTACASGSDTYISTKEITTFVWTKNP